MNTSGFIMNRGKFKNLVHYICHKVRDPSRLGLTKLNKVLYYADFLFFLETYHSITDEKYIKAEHGPVSEHLNSILEELEKEGAVLPREQAVIDFTRHELVSVKRPDISMFSAEEIALVDEIINVISNGHTAQSISELSHDEAWEVAEYGEEIPYYTILGRQTNPTPETIKWAERKLTEKYPA